MKFFEIEYKYGKKRGKTILEVSNKLDAMKQFQNMELGVIKKIKEIDEPLSIKIAKFQEHFNDPIKEKRVNTENYISVLMNPIKQQKTLCLEQFLKILLMILRVVQVLRVLLNPIRNSWVISLSP